MHPHDEAALAARPQLPLAGAGAIAAALLALAGALSGGRALEWALVGATLAAAAALAVLGRRRALASARLAAMLLCLGAAAGAGAFWAAGHARSSYPAEWPVPDVIGLRPAQALQALLAHGPVTITIRRVWNLPAGRVGRIHGTSYYGTYSRGSQLVLDVGR